MFEFLESFLSITNNILWSYVLIILLISIGLYFTIKTKFVQFTLFGHMFKLLGEGAGKSIT